MKYLLKTIRYGLLLFTVTQPILSQPTDGIIAYYPFGGNANDVTGNLRNGSVSNASLVGDRFYNSNHAYYFNGSNSFIYLPNNLMQGNTAFAISCWIQPYGNHATAETWQGIIDLRGQYQIALSYNQPSNTTNPNSVVFYVYSSPNTKTITSANNSVQPGTWYHLVANYANNTMTFYINSVLIGTVAQTPPGAVSGYNNTIGKDYNLNLNRGWFYGAIDEVIFYKRGLTPSEIQTIYNLGLTQKDLPALYGPTTYSYDAMGNRIGRNTIRLKSSAFYAAKRDSATMAINDSIAPGEIFEKAGKDYTIKIFPNPTRGELKVQITNFDFSQNSAIHVYSASGKLVAQKSPATGSDIIDLLSQPNGMYVMKILLGEKTSEWKIIKE
jgi:hypothetical protein